MLDLVYINVFAKFYQNIPHGQFYGQFSQIDLGPMDTASSTDTQLHKLTGDEHTNWSWADNAKLKEQEFSFLPITHCLISWANLWSFIKLSWTVQELSFFVVVFFLLLLLLLFFCCCFFATHDGRTHRAIIRHTPMVDLDFSVSCDLISETGRYHPTKFIKSNYCRDGQL